ncbi:MAG TPA: hypothetical protein PLS94_00215 [Prolixibacteraceae bacterium]|nr:hypothetical protein [Prolixibacteraceae bacterium]HPR60852.1 hypothetical protein [Prolixibacteraceae bacterium]
MIIGLLRTILVIAIIYFIIKWVAKMFEPNKQQANHQQQYKKNEGETTIQFNKKGEKIINKNEGEYVDFEEVK